MPAGANTAFYARRHRGRAARDAVLTANGATSANTEDGNKSASHQAPPVECTARNDSVKTASPSVHTPQFGSDKGGAEHKSDLTPNPIGSQVPGNRYSQDGKIIGISEKDQDKSDSP